MSQKALTLLHVERDDDHRAIVSIALRLDDDITVFSSSNLRDARVDMSSGRFPVISALILDAIPKDLLDEKSLDGLRDHNGAKTIPLIFLTSRLMPHDLAAMQAAGAIAVIGKPFDPLTLSAQVRAALLLEPW